MTTLLQATPTPAAGRSRRTIIWTVVAFGWVLVRGALFAQAVTWTLPDSVKYLSEDVPIRLDGRTASPGWLIVLIYRLLPSDEARVWMQFVVGTVCWALAAWILASRADRMWQKNAVAGFVLVMGLSLPVISLDRILQTESLAMSLAVLWVGLWVRVLGRDVPDISAWWMTLVMLAAVFVRPQLGLLMGVAGFGLLAWRWYRARRPLTVVIVPLLAAVAAMGWSLSALAQFDRYNGHDIARAYFMSWYRGTDPEYKAMEVEFGRPVCPTLDSYTRDVAEASKRFAWNYYFTSYRKQCPELAAWHARSAPDYVERVLNAPGATARLAWRDVPFLVQPWVRGENPALLGGLQATLFGITDQSGMVNTDPQPGVQSLFDSPRAASPYTVNGMSMAPIWALLLWLVITVVLVFLSRSLGLRWSKRYGLGFMALLAVSLAGIGLSWVGDSWEMDRHSLPWSFFMPFLLIVGALLSWRSSPHPSQRTYGGVPFWSAAVMWSTLAALLVGLSWVQAGEAVLADPTGPLPSSAVEADALRERLQAVFFDNGERPSADRVVDVRLAELPAAAAELKRESAITARFTVNLRDGVVVTGYMLDPKEPSRCVVIFNGGHGPWWVGSIEYLRSALRKGCVVAAMNMPLIEAPTTVEKNGVTLNVATPRGDHFGLATLARQGDNVLDLFVTAPLSLIDWFETARPGQPVIITGFSGGGFVTTSVAALDRRAVRTVAVAGSAGTVDPDNCVDDYEQCLPELVKSFTMEQLYFLSAFGAYADGTARKAGQVLNEYDPCCHAGPVDPSWVEEVNASLVLMGPDRFIYRLSTTQPPWHRIPVEAEDLLRDFIDEVT